MSTYQSDDSVGERVFENKAVAFLTNLSSELSTERLGAEFRISVSGYAGMDDSAKYAKLFQIGPERGIIRKKRKELVSARIANYRGGNYPIQIHCSEAALEQRAVSGFEAIGKTQHENPVHVYRCGY
jgi:hypothetical protein